VVWGLPLPHHHNGSLGGLCVLLLCILLPCSAAQLSPNHFGLWSLVCTMATTSCPSSSSFSSLACTYPPSSHYHHLPQLCLASRALQVDLCGPLQLPTLVSSWPLVNPNQGLPSVLASFCPTSGPLFPTLPTA
jgi:hypothetical protein